MEDKATEIRAALGLPTCPYCNSVVTAQQKISPGHCGSEPCFLAHIAKGQAALQEQRDQDYAERQATARAQSKNAIATASKAMDCAIDDVIVAVMPFQNEPLAPITEDHRAAFEAHLDQATDAAFAVTPEDGVLAHYDQNTKPEASIIDAGCAACQGFCCKRGGGDNHAFITRQSIYYILRQQPELTKEDVIEHFLNAIPEESVQGACIYQSANGCTLTREWRAGLCNTFHCHDLFALHDVTGGRADVPLVFAGINDDETGSVGMFDLENGWQPLGETN